MLLNELMLMNGDDPDPPDDDGNDPWTDIEDFDRDGAIRRFVQKHRGFRYARKRETLRKQWEALENQITAVYLENKVTMLNWTTETSYLDVISPDCQCAAGLFHIRKMDLIDILGRSNSVPVPFCPCLPEPIQLIYRGYLAASPTQPRTAFSIPLLQQHHDLWLTSVTARSSYIEGHLNFLDKRSSRPLLAKGGHGNRRNLAQPFTSATHLYTRITAVLPA
ncbi:uncharacterized protein MELLADRAFT_110106 [Melampsora larici-populina 98AG31]|uniref:CxC1-like cysteine cluster associated with KDZ transposases domain-containing protein n=1 Tax=Melampsora larici-populina (strain 98AG31 / pathotype 3-4-7) TaxID=747676 RepID=F4RYP3_MELLP|nr:uncharacterized protein MELLADRAFT_110106 [Melampsora larici-populina 98AG31]EGG02506.1 hypothetical protein MELLADRAFT_110106 [Melampsora larici-populina 98AG31]